MTLKPAKVTSSSISDLLGCSQYTERKPSIQPHTTEVLPDQTPNTISFSFLPIRVPPRNHGKMRSTILISSSYKEEKAHSVSPQAWGTQVAALHLSPSPIPASSAPRGSGPWPRETHRAAVPFHGLPKVEASRLSWYRWEDPCWPLTSWACGEKRAGGPRANPHQKGGKAGWKAGMCEVIPSINNQAELARPVPHPSPSSKAIPVTQWIPNEYELYSWSCPHKVSQLWGTPGCQKDLFRGRYWEIGLRPSEDNLTQRTWA